MAGLWTVRAAANTPIGFAWGVACIGAGLRWGTLSLSDLEVATRLAGPSLAAGDVVVRAGMVLALAAAVLGEASIDGLRARSWDERVAAFVAITALVPLFLAEGPTDLVTVATLAWPAFAAALTVAVLLLRPLAHRLPAWVPGAGAVVGVATAMSVS